jgi:uncharacterized repeat protein (TIGR03803 family)
VANRVSVLSVVWALAFAGAMQAQSFKVVHTFNGTDGAYPEAQLVQDTAGNSYGTTFDRGASGYGTVFKTSPAGKTVVLYNFGGPPDGANPAGPLWIDSSDNLYGTTEWGGSSNFGTVFKIGASGQETLLHSFAGGSDGVNPEGGVIEDSSGNLYGTTEGGGTGAGCGGYYCGIVFKLDSAGSETILYTFNGDTSGGVVDGANPWAGLVLDADGNLYGTTVYGGTAGYGTVFKVSSSGSETLLYQFTGGSDGAYPYSNLIFDTSGNLYGTAYEGGSGQVGTAFRLEANGSFSVLHTFTGGAGDGGYPAAGLVIDSSGDLYGTTVQGGQANYGTVFEIDSSGSESVLHGFAGGGKGLVPETGVTLDKSGNLWGTTYYGGPKDASFGTIFKLIPTPKAE